MQIHHGSVVAASSTLHQTHTWACGRGAEDKNSALGVRCAARVDSSLFGCSRPMIKL